MGSHVNNEFVAGTLRAVGEYAIQVPQFSATYDQYGIHNKYDLLGSYDPKGSVKMPKNGLSGAGYWSDSVGDIQNSINGAGQNFNYIEDKQQYDQLFNQWKNERNN